MIFVPSVGDILCVASGFDSHQVLKLLRFHTRKGGSVTIPEYYCFPTGPRGRFYSFSSKGYPLTDIRIDQRNHSKIKASWHLMSKNAGYAPVFLHSGNGTFKKYSVKTKNYGVQPNDSCYWSDESLFHKYGQINRIAGDKRGRHGQLSKQGVAFKLKYGRAWGKSHVHGAYVYAIKDIIGFAYSRSTQAIGFRTRHGVFTFGTVRSAYKSFSLYGRQCRLAFLAGYSKMHFPERVYESQTSIDRLFDHGRLMQVIPHWMCEVPNYICKKTASRKYNCSCIDGFKEHHGIYKKKCASVLPDKYLNLEILENKQYPTDPE